MCSWRRMKTNSSKKNRYDYSLNQKIIIISHITMEAILLGSPASLWGFIGAVWVGWKPSRKLYYSTDATIRWYIPPESTVVTLDFFKCCVYDVCTQFDSADQRSGPNCQRRCKSEPAHCSRKENRPWGKSFKISSRLKELWETSVSAYPW